MEIESTTTEHSENLDMWDKSVWIGCGRQYSDVPSIVQHERRRLLQVPPRFQYLLPSVDASVETLLHATIPLSADEDVALDPILEFSDKDPAELAFIGSDTLLLHTIPSIKQQIHLERSFGQCWFDGARSIYSSETGQCLPFWVLSFFSSALKARRIQKVWNCATKWLLETTNESTLENNLRAQIMGSTFNQIHWTGSIPGIQTDARMEDLAQVLGNNPLPGGTVNAMLNVAAARLRRSHVSDNTIITTTEFPHAIVNKDNSPGYRRYLEKYQRLFLMNSDNTCTFSNLLFVVHSPPFHWVACLIDFKNNVIQFGDGLRQPPPSEFVKRLSEWLLDNFGVTFAVQNNFECGTQSDSYSCPIISVNAVEHYVFGDPVWTSDTARVLRMKAFLQLVREQPEISTTVTRPPADDSIITEPDINDDLIQHFPSVSAPPDTSHSLPTHSGSQTLPCSQVSSIHEPKSSKKRSREDEMEDGNEIMPKQQKLVDHPFFAVFPRKPKGFQPVSPNGKVQKTKKITLQDNLKSSVSSAKKAKKPVLPEVIGMSEGGQSASAIVGRDLRRQANAGTLEVSTKKWNNFVNKCTKFGGSPKFDLSEPDSVTCLACTKRVRMKEPYNTFRWKEHIVKCSGPISEPQTITDFDEFHILSAEEVAQSSQARTLPTPPRIIQKPCPGLTKSFDLRIENYLLNTQVDGAGSHSLSHFSEKLYGCSYRSLSDSEKSLVQTAVTQGRTWRNCTEGTTLAVFAAGEHPCSQFLDVQEGSDEMKSEEPCDACVLVFRSQSFQKALNKERAPIEKLKYIPKIYTNPTIGLAYARYKGLEGLFEESKNLSQPVMLRYVHHVLNGDFKDDQVFCGLVEAMVIGKERTLKGKGTQNMQFLPDYNEFLHAMHDMSPRVYRAFSSHFKTRTARSIKDKNSKEPRFPIGIQDRTFELAEKYLEEYKWPKSYPLAFAVDDTKLFAMLAPLYDPETKQWRLVGTVGESSIVIPNIETYREMISKEEYQTATKVRLWTLQIPVPGVPALPLAVLPISSTYKASELADYQTRLFGGLISRNFLPISMGADGAAVERDCQKRTVTAIGKEEKHHIQYPGGEKSDFCITYYSRNDICWTLTQDPLHFLKTARNNAFTGARLLVLGDFIVYYQQIAELAVHPSSPLYRRDVYKYDKQDDNAAARLFSAAMLEHSLVDVQANMGLIVYLFVFGEFVDAFQSRYLPHKDRATIVIRTLLFLQSWRNFLAKMEYPEHRHFISKAAYDICMTCGNSLLALLIIHRDRLPTLCPLIPHKHATEVIEHLFAELRKRFPDFNMQQALLSIPKLGRMSKTGTGQSAKFSKPTYKQTASGYQHAFLDDHSIEFDYKLLSQFPTDMELSEAYRTASDENDTLWSLLHIQYPDILHGIPTTDTLATTASDIAVTSEEAEEDEDEENEEDGDACVRTQLQEVINRIDSTAYLSGAEDKRLDMYELASIALSLQELADINDLPEPDPQRIEALRAEVARAITQHPQEMIALLQNASSSLQHHGSTEYTEVAAHQLENVSPNDLASLVSIRISHQSKQAATGVRTHKASNRESIEIAGKLQVVSDRQRLAWEMNSILRQADERGTSTGLNRKVRWTGKASTESMETAGGNVVNAEIAAKGRASEALKRRRAIFSQHTTMHNIISEALISKQNPIRNNSYGFIIVGKDLLAARVFTMYCKNGGKAGAHAAVTEAESIGSLSFLSVQTFEYSGRRKIFHTIHRKYATTVGIGLRRFSHLPSHSFLVLVADSEVSETQTGLTLSNLAWKTFESLWNHRADIAEAVAKLKFIRHRGKASESLDNDDDGVDADH